MTRQNLSLLTDLYQLTMSSGYFENGFKDQVASFSLFFRKNPFKGHYAVSCGLRTVIDFIQDLKFENDDIEYLKSLTGNDGKRLFSDNFLNYLSKLKFEGDLHALEEGTIVFPHQPLIRIEAPIILCQLLETPLLNIMNFQTLIATKASRVCTSAEGDSVLEFGLRRAQGVDGAMSASYAAIVGGVQATSNVLAGKKFGIPVKGTHAHSWVMSFPDELSAFESYAKVLPNNCIFLVDTYDTVNGVKNAIKVGKELRKNGHEMIGIRLDSGDLCDLSIKARKILDDSGFESAKIVASNDLDEYKITELKKNGAKIDIWGVGTKLVTGYDQPALGGVYKLSALKGKDSWTYKIKKSENKIKISNPGVLQTRRYISEDKYLFDVIVNEHDIDGNSFRTLDGEQLVEIPENADYVDMLKLIFQKGQLVYNHPSIEETISLRNQEQTRFEADILSFGPIDKKYLIGLDSKLFELKEALLNKIGN